MIYTTCWPMKMITNVKWNRGWLPDPDLEDVPLEKGAGMYKAVGRMITLTRTKEIRIVKLSCWAIKRS